MLKYKIFFTFFCILIILFLTISPCYAIYQGQNTYTDPNTNLAIRYESTINDFIRRVTEAKKSSDDTNSGNTTYDDMMKYLSSPRFSAYICYGNSSSFDGGLSMIGGMRFKTDYMFLVLYDNSNVSASSSMYETFMNLNCDIMQYSSGFTTAYRISYSSLLKKYQFSKVTYDGTFYMPTILQNYVSNSLLDYIHEYNFGGTEDITSAIQNQTDELQESIQQSTNTLNDSLTSTNYDENTVNIDTSSTDAVSDSETTGLFSTLFNNFSQLLNSSSWDTVDTIDIGLPYVDTKIQLRSDILSSLVGSALLCNLINISWYSVFGLYVFKFVNNLIHSIKSGDILGGLSLNNEVITSTML